MKLTLKYERSTKHSYLYKNEDGSNLYIKKDHLGEKPPTVLTVSDSEQV